MGAAAAAGAVDGFTGLAAVCEASVNEQTERLAMIANSKRVMCPPENARDAQWALVVSCSVAMERSGTGTLQAPRAAARYRKVGADQARPLAFSDLVEAFQV